MKRLILIVAMLAVATITVYGQQPNRLLIEKDGTQWLRVDDQGVYYYAPGFNAERIINEMAAMGAKQLSSLTPGVTEMSISYGLVITLSTAPNGFRLDSAKPKHYAHAQQQGPKPIAEVKPVPVPEVELVAAGAESSAEIRNALQNEEAARLAYENAQTRTANTLLRALGEASIKPSECQRQTPQGINPFDCWKVDRQTGASSFEKPKVKK